MESRIAHGWLRAASDRLVLLFGATTMVSASLIFVVQPMFSKMVLPLLGGAPAVWNTAMMFFQGTLLLGYTYAHLLTRHFSWRNQVMLHLALMSIAFLALPIAPYAGWLPPTDELPIPWLVGLFSVSVGLPFFAIAANAPLLQRWFSVSSNSMASDPYFLYAASNFGSIAALLAYPLLIEPAIGLSRQSSVWTVGYASLLALIALCAFSIRRNAQSSAVAASDDFGSAARSDVTWPRRINWMILSFVPSSLLLGVTAHIATDIASAPFIWVLPLALYLLSFIFVFSRRVVLRPAWMIKAQPYLVIVVAISLWGAAAGWLYFLLLHLVTFFVCAMVCHGELAKRRPAPADLTSFYFFMSLGGFLGGVFNALIAPVLFDTVAEYPIALVLACLLRPATSHSSKFNWALDVLLPTGLLLAVAIPGRPFGAFATEFGPLALFPLLVAVGIILFSFRDRPVRFALGIGAAVVALAFAVGPRNVLDRERSFFGVHWVQAASAGQFNLLWNGTTEHGAQHTAPPRWREPLSYYHRDGPFGQIFRAFAGTENLKRVGVIGLGAGALACYRKSGDDWTFFEIDPVVVRLAISSRYFHYLSECAPDASVVIGDARLSLQRAPDSFFGLLVVDAFSSDAIPVHLMTREAVALYRAKLQNDGVLVLHISNRHLDLEPILARLAHDAGLIALANEYRPLDTQQRANIKREAHVVVIGRTNRQFDHLVKSGQWRKLSFPEKFSVWTDDYSNVLGALRN